MKKIDFLLNWFYKENDRRIELESSMNIPISILTALIAGIYFLILNYNFKSNIVLDLIFMILISLCVIFWLISICNLIISYNNFFKGFSYKTFPNANFLDIETKNINEYYEKYKEDLKSEGFNQVKQIESNVCEFLKECIDYNTIKNDKKSFYLYRCKIHLIICIISL